MQQLGKIKLMCKAHGKNDEARKLIGKEACEDGIPNITTKHCKKHTQIKELS